MIQIPYEDMIAKIVGASELSSTDVESKVKAKMEQLSGLISKDGAAHIIANELGVKLIENTTGKLKIDSILPGMRNVETVGKVVAVYDVREFNTGTRSGKVGSMIIGDETGTTRIVCWGDQTDKIAQVKVEDIVRLKDGFVKENRGNKEIHLNDRSLFQINPAGETVGEVKATIEPQEASRKSIADLQGTDGNVEVLATVVQAFEPKYFEVCPDCGGRARPNEEGYQCQQHGKVTPEFSYLVNVFLDDGTSNIRTVFFRDQVEALLGMTKEQILEFKDTPEAFEKVKNDLMGSLIKVKGRVKVNQMFDRLEFTANSVDRNPDPEQELKSE